MKFNNPIPEGKQCNHITCRDVCHRVYKERKTYTIKKTPLKRSNKPISKVSKNSTRKPKIEGLWEWFLERRKEMRGICDCCGGKTEKYNDNTFHFSIAHLIEKRNAPSVATHERNFLELCYYGNSCHKNLDDNIIALSDMPCFDLVIARFQAMYPSIAINERRYIPAILLNYIEVDS